MKNLKISVTSHVAIKQPVRSFFIEISDQCLGNPDHNFVQNLAKDITKQLDLSCSKQVLEDDEGLFVACMQGVADVHGFTSFKLSDDQGNQAWVRLYPLVENSPHFFTRHLRLEKPPFIESDRIYLSHHFEEVSCCLSGRTLEAAKLLALRFLRSKVHLQVLWSRSAFDHAADNLLAFFAA